MRKTSKIAIILALCILLNIIFVQSATISGTVFSVFLEELDTAIITIDTTPEQTIVSKQGKYSFNLPIGEYTLTAVYEEKGEIYSTEETITITEEGDFTIDIILMPELDEDIIIETEDEFPEFEPQVSNTGIIVTVIAIILLISYLIITKRFFINNSEEIKSETEEDLGKLIKFIKEKGGRVTQKDIRKKFPLSEAKISLMISELESKKKIKKIKKGRGNIIILSK